MYSPTQLNSTQLNSTQLSSAQTKNNIEKILQDVGRLNKNQYGESGSLKRIMTTIKLRLYSLFSITNDYQNFVKKQENINNLCESVRVYNVYKNCNQNSGENLQNYYKTNGNIDFFKSKETVEEDFISSLNTVKNDLLGTKGGIGVEKEIRKYIKEISNDKDIMQENED